MTYLDQSLLGLPLSGLGVPDGGGELGHQGLHLVLGNLVLLAGGRHPRICVLSLHNLIVLKDELSISR